LRIGFNARALSAPHIRGWTRYALQLLRHLPESGAELVLFTDRELNPEFLAQLVPGSFRIVASPAMRYIAWEQVWLPFVCARERVEVLHAPANYGLPLVRSCPQVLTLHDAIDLAFEPTQGRQGLGPRINKASFWAARRSAKRVITVSAHAKADLVKYYSIPASKVVVIHEASDLHERIISGSAEQSLFDELRINREFVLYVGGFERRKNVEFLVDAFLAASLEGTSLVLVGSNPPPPLVDKVRRAPEGSIQVTGFLPDAKLAALYRRALAFVYPSLYEGFGLQLCEAMSFGCPTLASNATSLPEVLGDGGDTFSPTQTDALVQQLRRVRHDTQYRQQLAARALLRIKDFSWQNTARSTYEVYRCCVASGADR